MNVVPLSLSQNVLLYVFIAFSILTKHLSHTVAITFAIWGARTKLPHISFSSFTISQIEDSFLPLVLATSAYVFFLFPY